MRVPAAASPPVDLVPIAPEHRETIYRWYEDPERVAPFDRYEPESFPEFVRSVEEAPGDPRSLAPRFSVLAREGGQLVGCVGHYRPHPILETIEVWYLIGEPSARGRGFGAAAVGALIDRLYATTDVERVGATCDVENVASYRLLERLGLERQGRLPAALFHHGRWHDVFLYGTTRSAWARAGPGR
ncbi:MAG: GNAT family protein [Thermoplasmata archaeon]